MEETIAESLEVNLLLVFLALACMVGLLGGALLMLRPHWVERFGRHANRWISTRRFNNTLERIIDADKWFYRHHRASGWALLGGSGWIVGYFVLFFDKYRFIPVLSRIGNVPPAMVDGMLDSFVLFILLGAVCAAIIGLFLMLRPSLLRGFEAHANHWVSTRRALRPLEVPREGADGYVLRHGQLFGLLLLGGSLFMLGMLIVWVHWRDIVGIFR